jgi:hypothetical protein
MIIIYFAYRKRTGAEDMPEPVWHERHLVGFGNRLKDEDRIKAKVAESLAVKGRTAAEAMKLIPDAIRYTFQYDEALGDGKDPPGDRCRLIEHHGPGPLQLAEAPPPHATVNATATPRVIAIPTRTSPPARPYDVDAATT